MSKAEILAELPKLGFEDRREIFDGICELEEKALLNGSVTPEEKVLLDEEMREYLHSPEAGSSWEEVEARIRKQTKS